VARVVRRVLVVVTCALALVAIVVALDRADSSPSSEQRRSGPPQSTAPLPGRVVTTVGVASFNVYRHLPRRLAVEDALRLTAHDEVDVIGWQETRASYFPAVKRRLDRRGWNTWQLWRPNGPFWLAVSWRRDRFSLVDGKWTEVHGGAGRRRTDLPFPPRGYVAVILRHRSSGQLLTVLDTHLNQGIETGARFQDTLNATYAKEHLSTLAEVWDKLPGQLVVGTGDFNFDFRDDFRARPAGGIWRTQHGHATSSYEVLGTDGVQPTRGSRWIDYVWIADRTLRVRARDTGSGQFVRHESLGGFHSDHRPLLAEIRWYDR
jgi:hypothetical protein